ncbi:MAG: hypothetical protein K2G31_02775 [Clostridia bacterium]|nr:hypothetical protein [Clostridia bacterium]
MKSNPTDLQDCYYGGEEEIRSEQSERNSKRRVYSGERSVSLEQEFAHTVCACNLLHAESLFFDNKKAAESGYFNWRRRRDSNS